MSAFSDVMRNRVAVRAGQRCEYCHLPTRGQVATFPIDHVIPRSRDGSNDADNLALTCPHCNAQKWTAVEAADPVTGQMIPIFHPRQQIWEDHFEWSRTTRGELLGKTPVGRATIVALDANAGEMLALRQLLAELGLFAEVAAS